MKDYEELLENKGYSEIDSLDKDELEWAKFFKESIKESILENENITYDKIQVYMKLRDINTTIDDRDIEPIKIGVGLFFIYTTLNTNDGIIVIRYDSFIKVLDAIEIRSKEELNELNKIYDEFEYDLIALSNIENKDEWSAA